MCLSTVPLPSVGVVMHTLLIVHFKMLNTIENVAKTIKLGVNYQLVIINFKNLSYCKETISNTLAGIVIFESWRLDLTQISLQKSTQCEWVLHPMHAIVIMFSWRKTRNGNFSRRVGISHPKGLNQYPG